MSFQLVKILEDAPQEIMSSVTLLGLLEHGHYIISGVYPINPQAYFINEMKSRKILSYRYFNKEYSVFTRKALDDTIYWTISVTSFMKDAREISRYNVDNLECPIVKFITFLSENGVL